MRAQLPGATNVERKVGTPAAFFWRIAEQLRPKCQPFIDLTLEDCPCVNVIARFCSGPPPLLHVAVQRPLVPAFLRDQRQYKRRSSFAEAARLIARRYQQLRINAKLEL